MRITKEFEVDRSVGDVWDFFQDVPSVAQCLPGATITQDKGDGLFSGNVTVKLGPMSAKFDGEATITPDAEAKSAHISGKGIDRSGGSAGKVEVDYRVVATESGSMVTVDAEVTLSGTAARFGRSSLIDEMSTRLIAEFVECLDKKLAATSPEIAATVTAGEVKGVSLFFSSLWTSIAGFFKRLFSRH
jgi:carbon monoxide dehydrogenase subunit G